MLQRIRKSRTTKGISVLLIISLLFEILAPNQVFALTGGPAQPEFGSFTPVGTSDMVDLSSGDMTYNIPLMDVGGYPLNIAYNSGVGMDDEASWVGLGWNLSVGQINRNVRGLPDDFQGDELVYENDVKNNVTVGARLKVKPHAFGVDVLGNNVDVNLSLGLSVEYNNYRGFSVKPSVGASVDLGKNASVGFNAESGPDGLTLSPSVSIHKNVQDNNKKDTKLTGTIGASFNSRQGLQALTLNMDKKSQYAAIKMKRSNGSEKTIQKAGNSPGSVGSSIGFNDNLYTPNKRVGMKTGSFTVNAAIGGEIWGVEVQGQITAYGSKQSIKDSEKYKTVRAYGYEHTEKAYREMDDYEEGGAEDVLDFNREKDGSFSVNTTNLPLTNYTYDIYSVQGQGVSGMYRPFRSQVGYVFDTYVKDDSFSGTLGLEFGAGNAVHVGVDLEGNVTESHSGPWLNDNSLVNPLKGSGGNPFLEYESVYFKNVGDLGVDQNFADASASNQHTQLFAHTGAYQPARIPFVGSKFFRSLQNKLIYKVGLTQETNFWGNQQTVDDVLSKNITEPIRRDKRHLRNQAVYNLKVSDVRAGKGYGPWVQRNPNNNETQSTISPVAKEHHTAEVQIIRNDGARYVYGLPVYNTSKKECSFAVSGTPIGNSGLIAYGNDGNKPNYQGVNDEYFNRVTTPAYVHTHLLTSVLSTDYQDRGNNGPSEDDLGTYTHFTYKKVSSSYKWRVPYMNANYNESLKSEEEDDQANYTYGEKEMYVIDKIFTKTHVAVFTTTARKDAKGAAGEHATGIGSDNSFKLVSIALYSLPEYKANSGNLANANPIKVAHFRYSYDLCKGVPNNNGAAPDVNEISNNRGKLTLKAIYFTYRKSAMGKYTGYKFDYNETDANQNPNYDIKGYDSWGNYMPNVGNGSNTSVPTAPEYPYVDQKKTDQDVRAAVWTLKKISLPSGGNIEIDYESDDYNYVQDKQALRMFKVVGAGKNQYANTANDPNGTHDVVGTSDIVPKPLYGAGLLNNPNYYLYAEIPDPAGTGLTDNSAVVKEKYLSGLPSGMIQFRFFMNMTQAGGSSSLSDAMKYDYVSGYCEVDHTKPCSYFTQGTKHYIAFAVKPVNKEGGLGGAADVHPISKAAWHFARRYLSKHAYSNQPNGDTDDLEEIVADLLSPQMLNNLMEIFTGPNGALENKLVGRNFVTNKSWVRLKNNADSKLGGGSRVKAVKMNDVWGNDINNPNDPDEMNQGAVGYEEMTYGQEYKYTLAGSKKSSGVATYEPSGNKENPFVEPVFSTVKHLLAPDDENYVEKPFGESFFPSPQVTYSRVEVSNLTLGKAPVVGAQIKQLHKTGKVVTEFYTSKDYPTIVDQTQLQAKEDKRQLLDNLLDINVRKHFTASQGYVVHLNDMNGKQKSQRVYAEGQEEYISGVDYLYDNYAGQVPASTGQGAVDADRGKLNNAVTVIYPDGRIKTETIGVESDVVMDFRENATESDIYGVNANLATFFVGIIPGLVPIPLPDYSHVEDQFRSVSVTKVINTFGILKETIAHDAGASVSTRNLAWDALTGEVLVTETVDEYADKYYTLNYPAHWNYDAMGQASQNLGMKAKLDAVGAQTFKLNGYSNPSKYLIAGDEMVYLNGSNLAVKAWVVNVNTSTFQLLDENGNYYNSAALANKPIEIVRSGHRNLQSAGIMNVTLMRNPLKDAGGNPLTSISSTYLMSGAGTDPWNDWRIINAGAVLYSDVWEPPCECGFPRMSDNPNPYVINAKGVWRTKSSRTYLTGRHYQAQVTPRRDGFFQKFSPMYKLNAGNWSIDLNQWTFVSQVSKFSPYGFELENQDALGRYSAAQYGYNQSFPMAVGANTRYREIGFDGFEDYDFLGCEKNPHFGFKGALGTGSVLPGNPAHTGRNSIRVGSMSKTTIIKNLDCDERIAGPADPEILTEDE